MKQTTKNILGVAAIVLLSSGVAGLTTYKMLNKEKPAAFSELFQQNPNNLLPAAFHATDAQPVDLPQAAESSLHAVVHICVSQLSKTQTVQEQPDIFDFFFGDGRGQQRQLQTQPRVGFGSGVIISKDGYIVTNNHVVEGADEITVKLNDDRELKGRIIGTDPSTDLALIKIEGDDFPTVPVGNSDELKVGEWVLAVGNPFNLNSTVTAGIVSAKDRTNSTNTTPLIQTDAAINPGNSGGALLNMKGEVIGINSSKYSDTTVEGMGYAIPITAVQDRLDDLMNRQTREKVDESEKGYLGISCATVSSDVSEAYGIPEGVLVTDVASKRAAEKAGIKANYVITKIDGQSIRSAEELTEKLNYYAVGETVPITYEYLKDDAYVEKTVDVTLMENPNANNK